MTRTPENGTTLVIAAAFDLGLKATGAAWADDSDTFVSPAHLHRSPMDDARITERLGWWGDTFRTILLPFAGVGAIVAVEAPFIHPKHVNGAMRLLELHGVFRVTCAQADIDVVTVTPSELKKWATGNGNANKADMVAAAVALGWDPGCDIGEADHNEADAYLLWTMKNEREVAA